jgi:hypothetical protein
MSATRFASVLGRHFGIDRADRALAEGRGVPLSAGPDTAHQSLARMEGAGPFGAASHIRRYFIRADDAHKQPSYWRDQRRVVVSGVTRRRQPGDGHSAQWSATSSALWLGHAGRNGRRGARPEGAGRAGLAHHA